MHCKPLMYVMYVYALQSHVVLFTTPMIRYLQTISTNRQMKKKIKIKNRTRSRLVPKAQECLVVCVAN